MIYVTSLPHPRAPEKMRRTTFVCRACNQTRSYSLSIPMAEVLRNPTGTAAVAASRRPGRWRLLSTFENVSVFLKAPAGSPRTGEELSGLPRINPGHAETREKKIRP